MFSSPIFEFFARTRCCPPSAIIADWRTSETFAHVHLAFMISATPISLRFTPFKCVRNFVLAWDLGIRYRCTVLSDICSVASVDGHELLLLRLAGSWNVQIYIFMYVCVCCGYQLNELLWILTVFAWTLRFGAFAEWLRSAWLRVTKGWTRLWKYFLAVYMCW